MNKHASEAFRSALDDACGYINEAARLSTEIFAADELGSERGETIRVVKDSYDRAGFFQHRKDKTP